MKIWMVVILAVAVLPHDLAARSRPWRGPVFVWLQEDSCLRTIREIALKDELQSHAEAHAGAWGKETNIQVLIPLMLEAFMSRDRAFKRKSHGG